MALNRSIFRQNNWLPIIFGISIFSLFFQIGLPLIWTSGFGFKNPYLSPLFSLPDLLLLTTGLVFIFRAIKDRKVVLTGAKSLHFLLILGLSFTLISILLTQNSDSLLNISLTTKILELYLLYILLVNHIIRADYLIRIVIYTFAFQSIIAILQSIFQHSIGLGFLGEPSFSSSNSQVARFTVGSIDIIRAYGTFTHPNILAAGLFLSFFLLETTKSIFRNEKVLLRILILIALVLTFSRLAFFALLIALVLINLKHIKKWIWSVIPLAILIFWFRGAGVLSMLSWTERLQGYRNAWNTIIDSPLGIGFAHFTENLAFISDKSLSPWDIQPVHNILLLLLSEWGVPLTIIMCLVIVTVALSTLLEKKNPLTPAQAKKRHLFTVLIAGLLLMNMGDHFLVSLDQGRTLGILYLGLASLISASRLGFVRIKTEDWPNKIPNDLE